MYKEKPLEQRTAEKKIKVTEGKRKINDIVETIDYNKTTYPKKFILNETLNGDERKLVAKGLRKHAITFRFEIENGCTVIVANKRTKQQEENRKKKKQALSFNRNPHN